MQRTEIDAELARLYETEAPKLWRAVLAYAGDREVASDSVAEAFAQYLRRQGDITAPKSWLWRAAFRIAAGELARRSTTREVPEDFAYEMPEVASLFHTLLALPPRQRAVIVLRYYVGYRPSEIADVLGLNGATVRVHLLQAHRKLRSLLEDSDEG